MMVHAAIAFALNADRPDRQLRLIDRSAEEGPEPAARPGSAGGPTTACEQTLAEYLWELTVGSPCFSCGQDLVAADGALACPVCGAVLQHEAA